MTSLKTTLSALAAAAALSLTAGAVLAQGAPALTHNPAEVKSGDYVLDPDHGKITFTVTHMGFSYYTGQFTGVEAKLHLDAAKPSESKLDATVPVAGIATSNPKLDTHLKTPDFFNADKFPAVSFHATKIVRTGPKTAQITGDLTLLGVTKPVTLEAEFLQAGQHPFIPGVYEVGFAAHGSLKRSEWGMSKYASVPGSDFQPVSDEVKLQFEGEFRLAQ
jgi:polyisoprenoid-binding protein YceI